MSWPIAAASVSEPPPEEIRTGKRRPRRLAIALAKAAPVPGMIRPSAEIHSGQFGWHAGSELMTRTIRIGGSARGRESLRSARLSAHLKRRAASASDSRRTERDRPKKTPPPRRWQPKSNERVPREIS